MQRIGGSFSQTYGSESAKRRLRFRSHRSDDCTSAVIRLRTHYGATGRPPATVPLHNHDLRWVAPVTDLAAGADLADSAPSGGADGVAVELGFAATK